MEAQAAVDLLRALQPELERRYGVRELALFGSVARGDASETSDIDVLVSFDGPATSARYFGVQFRLEDAFQRPVDLVTEAALRPELRPYVERDVRRV